MRNNIWVIADTHFGHTKLVEWGHRPEGFEELILSNLKKYVKENDTLIHLGDVELGRVEDLSPYGRVRILIKGNHDSRTDNKYYDMGFTAVCSGLLFDRFGKRIYFSHEPQEISEDIDFNIYGHTHGKGEVLSKKHIPIFYEGSDYKPHKLRDLIRE
jgi:calcineurin-like phosphoesterase family protein